MASVSEQSNLSIAGPAHEFHIRENAFMLVSLQGQNLGKYRVLEPLGRGGMAQVYRAYHPQLDRYVAIKVLRSDLVEEQEFLTRFRREAQSVANLRHPNIVQIHDFDVQEDVYYMVMELLEGDTLKAQLTQYRAKGERLPLGEIARIMLDVLSGLAYAHDEGIIHRDIKPANIMVSRRGQAVVTDFGIAQIIGSTQFTVSGALMGTLSYMAPEQGLEGRTSKQSDLYSTGIVLYEMLTGRPPFDADTPLAILMKHVNDPLPLPRTINPDLPEPFEQILLKALSKDPQDRYANAGELAKAIRAASAANRIEIPEQISFAAVSEVDHSNEAVAVFSGEDIKQITDAAFAKDDTEKYASEKVSRQLRSKDQPEKAMPAKRKGPSNMGKAAANAFFTAVIALVGFNLMAVMLGLFSGNWRIFRVGWPAEIILVSLGLCLMMSYSGSPAFFIPAGILLGNGVILAFYSLTGFWALWKFLWPLEPLLLIGSVLYFFWLTGRRDQVAELSSYAGRRMTQLAFVVLVITIAIAAIPIG